MRVVTYTVQNPRVPAAFPKRHPMRGRSHSRRDGDIVAPDATAVATQRAMTPNRSRKILYAGDRLVRTSAARSRGQPAHTSSMMPSQNATTSATLIPATPRSLGRLDQQSQALCPVARRSSAFPCADDRNRSESVGRHSTTPDAACGRDRTPVPSRSARTSSSTRFKVYGRRRYRCNRCRSHGGERRDQFELRAVAAKI